MIVKRGDKWCVIHAHKKKPGSKRDKPKGTAIGCHKAKKAAIDQHQAIQASKARKGKK
jgi:hypothetical protein